MWGMMTRPFIALTFLLLALASSATADVFNLPAGQTSLSFVTAGNPGNAPDTAVMSDGTSGYGSVPYTFQIGTYDVTNYQYAEFLNAKDPTGLNTLGLYNPNMGTDFNAGISFSSGNSDGAKYSVISGHGNQPVIYATWYSALRFVNWLNNGQGAVNTETGAYTLLGGGPTPTNALSITRNPGATFVLPSENEWYKAAFYDPATSSYFLYATSSNTAPNAVVPPGGPNSANYNVATGGRLTDVGAYTASPSPYGTFDQNGNVFQWNEQLIGAKNRGIRGGYYFAGKVISNLLLSTARLSNDPSVGNGGAIGFRVAVAPDPTTETLGDFYQDGELSGSDVSAMLQALSDVNGFKLTHGLSDADFLAVGDLNGDFNVTNTDIQALLDILKVGGDSRAAVSEGSSLELMSFGVAIISCYFSCAGFSIFIPRR